MTLALAGTALIAVSFALSTALGHVVRRVAPLVGLVDVPGGRKAHRAPTPLGGGVAIWLTMLIMLGGGWLTVMLFGSALPPEIARYASGLRERSAELWEIFGLATVIMLMGLIDDRFGLHWLPRLLIQLGLALVLVLLGARVTLFPPFSNPWISGTLTVFWIAGLTNSFNFLDNMDGLAAGVGLIAAAIFAAAQAAVGGLFVPAVLFILVGALAGFLVHNRYPARLFMGDAGSNFLGFLLGTMTVVGTFTRPYDAENPSSPFSVLTPLLVMAVPLYDTISVITIRIREGRSPFQADRRHFSHRLVERGLAPPRAVLTIHFITLAGGLGALLLHRPWLTAIDAALIVAQTVCLLAVVAILEMTTTQRTERPDGEGPAPTAADSTAHRHEGATR